MAARRETGRREPEREADAGFAIGIYDQRIIEDNARDRFEDTQYNPEFREHALAEGVMSPDGEITQKGWDVLNEDVSRIETNAMVWLRRKFISARDEGHGGHGGEELIGTFWYDPHNPDQAELVYLAADEGGRSERIDMTDSGYGDFALTAFDGVSDFGASILGGQINFFAVKPEDMEVVEQTVEAVEQSQRQSRGRGRHGHEVRAENLPRLVTGALSANAKRVHAGEYRGVRFEVYHDPTPARGAHYTAPGSASLHPHGYHYAAVVYTPYESERHGRGVEAEQIGFEPNTQGAQRTAERYIDLLLRPEPPVGHGPDLEAPRRRMTSRRGRRNH